LAALREGGVILTLPHSGNWDLAGAWAADQLGSLCTVAERLRPEGVFRKFLGMRRAIGITLMPLSGEPGVYEFLRDCVATGRVVALLGDRDVAGSGLGTPFFGHRAPMPIGASLLAVDTNRPLFTVSTYFDDRCLVIEFGDQVPVTGHGSIGRERLRAAAAATAEIAARFEKTIAERPDNWYQLQPVWPDLVAQ
jgi:KDO2-lipid IV(A) lauroyltransferase